MFISTDQTNRGHSDPHHDTNHQFICDPPDKAPPTQSEAVVLKLLSLLDNKRQQDSHTTDSRREITERTDQTTTRGDGQTTQGDSRVIQNRQIVPSQYPSRPQAIENLEGQSVACQITDQTGNQSYCFGNQPGNQTYSFENCSYSVGYETRPQSYSLGNPAGKQSDNSTNQTGNLPIYPSALNQTTCTNQPYSTDSQVENQFCPIPDQPENNIWQPLNYPGDQANQLEHLPEIQPNSPVDQIVACDWPLQETADIHLSQQQLVTALSGLTLADLLPFLTTMPGNVAVEFQPRDLWPIIAKRLVSSDTRFMQNVAPSPDKLSCHDGTGTGIPMEGTKTQQAYQQTEQVVNIEAAEAINRAMLADGSWLPGQGEAQPVSGFGQNMDHVQCTEESMKSVDIEMMPAEVIPLDETTQAYELTAADIFKGIESYQEPVASPSQSEQDLEDLASIIPEINDPEIDCCQSPLGSDTSSAFRDCQSPACSDTSSAFSDCPSPPPCSYTSSAGETALDMSQTKHQDLNDQDQCLSQSAGSHTNILFSLEDSSDLSECSAENGIQSTNNNMSVSDLCVGNNRNIPNLPALMEEQPTGPACPKKIYDTTRNFDVARPLSRRNAMRFGSLGDGEGGYQMESSEFEDSGHESGEEYVPCEHGTRKTYMTKRPREAKYNSHRGAIVKRSRRQSPQLWRFLLASLCDPQLNPSIIRWERKEEGIFRIVDTKKLPDLWGKRQGKTYKGSGKHKMNYEKFSRAIRYYYKGNVLKSVAGRLNYQFGPRATDWEAQANDNAG